jgi:transketolase
MTRDQLTINTLRFLAADAVEQASSGHPGMPMGAAPMAYALWTRFLRFDPSDPAWFDRDRFILSAGHGSMLLYGLLHLAGYDVSVDDLKDFRQWGSSTPGHPEAHMTPGVEATTGPLGQGFGNGVGMAMAERFLARRYSRDHAVVDHHIYAIVSDGDLMEGIASEAASLAGHMKLGKLVYLYDDNHISIEGSTDLTFTEDVGARFRAYGWHVVGVDDGEDIEAISAAIEAARADDRPSLIRVRTHIGYGSPKQDDASSHGAPLGEDALKATRETLGWDHEPFHVPDEAYAAFAEAAERGKVAHRQWNERLDAYRTAHPDAAAELDDAIAGRLPDGWDADIPAFEPTETSGKKLATRAASGQVLNGIARRVPNLLGGSADLAPSNKTLIDDEGSLADPTDPGRNIHFGVREHAMGAAVNGMALHGGVYPYAGTFLIFSDYMKPSIRLAALTELSAPLFIFTHDSIGVGEDGPTHQPIEQLAGLRSIPNLVVLRPADANETAEAWRLAMTLDRPVALSLTRQGLPVLDTERYPIREGVPKGGYTLDSDDGDLDLLLLATGSEVSLALDAAGALRDAGRAVRVVSIPSWELFREQPDAYRADVLPAGVPRLAIEAASPLGWHEWVGADGDVLALDRFGASAPGGEVMEKLGFNVENVVTRAKALL